MPKKPIIPKIPSVKAFKGIKLPSVAEAAGFPKEKPVDFPGSLAEYYCKFALDRFHATYNYITNVGGFNTLGSIQVDFEVYMPVQVAIRIQGEYWHYFQGSEQQAYDLLHKIQLMSRGWPVIDIDEDDILKDPLYYVSEALKLREHSRFTAPSF